MRSLRFLIGAISLLICGQSAVFAADSSLNSSDPFSGFELRASGLSHNIEPSGHERDHYDIGGSLLFPKVDTGLSGVANYWVPRAHIGTSVNLSGLTSFAYAGVTWSVPVWERFFVSADFGGAVNNSVPEGSADRVSMGCHATFRESAAIGRALTDKISIAATVEHFSNANLCDKNSGITNVGVMLGYKF